MIRPTNQLILQRLEKMLQTKDPEGKRTKMQTKNRTTIKLNTGFENLLNHEAFMIVRTTLTITPKRKKNMREENAV